jgi:nitrogen-specific signal transduction histidine kinase
MMTDPMGDPTYLAALRRLSAQDGRLEAPSEWSMVSFLLHEISSPLTVIQGFSQLIQEEALSREEIREYAADISKEAACLIELIVRTREQHRQMVEAASPWEEPRP